MVDLLKNGIDLSRLGGNKLKYSISLKMDKWNSSDVDVLMKKGEEGKLKNMELNDSDKDMFDTNQDELEQMMDSMLLGDGEQESPTKISQVKK